MMLRWTARGLYLLACIPFFVCILLGAAIAWLDPEFARELLSGVLKGAGHALRSKEEPCPICSEAVDEEPPVAKAPHVEIISADFQNGHVVVIVSDGTTWIHSGLAWYCKESGMLAEQSWNRELTEMFEAHQKAGNRT